MTRDNFRLAGAAAVAVALVAGVGLLIWRGSGDAAPAAAVQKGTAPPAAPVDAAKVVYDPTKLVENGVPAGEVFLKEPRDEVWAGAAEAAIGGKMRGDLERLVPGATLQMQCKTLSCLIGVDAPEDKRPLALAVVKVVMLGPLLVDVDPEEDGTQRFLFITEPRMSDPQVFTEWYQRIRKRTFAEIKAGSRPNPIPLPADQLPDE
jgi:hypothetical protein